MSQIEQQLVEQRRFTEQLELQLQSQVALVDMLKAQLIAKQPLA
jgi:hypothetical protein